MGTISKSIQGTGVAPGSSQLNAAEISSNNKQNNSTSQDKASETKNDNESKNKDTSSEIIYNSNTGGQHTSYQSRIDNSINSIVKNFSSYAAVSSGYKNSYLPYPGIYSNNSNTQNQIQAPNFGNQINKALQSRTTTNSFDRTNPRTEDWERFGGETKGSDPYQDVRNIAPGHKPTGTDDPLEDLSTKISEADKGIYERLNSLVNVYRNDSVGFGTNLDSADRSRQADLESRSQVLGFLTDTFKKDPNAQQYLDELERRGGMDVFLSETLSYGMNKSVGGFVSSGEGVKSMMALPYDLTNYTHTDIARHEGNHLKDSLADGKLDGLVIGENSNTKDTMIRLLEKFQAGSYDSATIEKLDIGNLRYGAGYLGTLKDSDPSNDLFAYTEARAVLEQEYADKPEEFKAIGGEFAELAETWKDTVATYDESYLQKDGYEDGTAMK